MKRPCIEELISTCSTVHRQWRRAITKAILKGRCHQSISVSDSSCHSNGEAVQESHWLSLSCRESFWVLSWKGEERSCLWRYWKIAKTTAYTTPLQESTQQDSWLLTWNSATVTGRAPHNLVEISTVKYVMNSSHIVFCAMMKCCKVYRCNAFFPFRQPLIIGTAPATVTPGLLDSSIVVHYMCQGHVVSTTTISELVQIWLRLYIVTAEIPTPFHLTRKPNDGITS